MSSIWKHLTPRKMLLFMILGAIVFGLYIYFSIGLGEMVAVLDNLNINNFLLFYSLSFLAMLSVMLLWTVPWRMLLKALEINVGLRRTFLYFLAGDFVDRIEQSA